MIRTVLAVAMILAWTPAFADSHNAEAMAMIEAKLQEHGIEYDGEPLTDEQVAAIENILMGSDDADAQKSAIMGILDQ